MRKTKLYQSCHASRPRSCHRSHRRRGITSACAEQTRPQRWRPAERRDHLRVCGADRRVDEERKPVRGSPPRVRSRRRAHCCCSFSAGITSACAEQTYIVTSVKILVQDHLRVCGADRFLILVQVLAPGSPPRVRSRRVRIQQFVGLVGITSACAEQTSTIRQTRLRNWDHLRVCGADRWRERAEPLVWGSPPRVRSRLLFSSDTARALWITSACAEQTPAALLFAPLRSDHLRVCGADDTTWTLCDELEGSPPRVRSRPVQTSVAVLVKGITSACAEQTVKAESGGHGTRDHLRVCGADLGLVERQHHMRGSPPRVRSRRTDRADGRRSGGITSACAEQTGPNSVGLGPRPDHLRVCGADRFQLADLASMRGSPPRVRSRHRGHARQWSADGITSACAEQTDGDPTKLTEN